MIKTVVETQAQAGYRTESKDHPVKNRRIRISGVALILFALVLPLFALRANTYADSMAWVFLIAAVIVGFTGLRALCSPLDLTEPIHWINFISLLIFSVHPFFLINSGSLLDPYHHIFTIAPYYPGALRLSFIGVVFINIGYLSSRRCKGRQHPVAFASISISTLRRLALVTSAIGMVGGSLNAVSGGGVSAFIGKSAASTSSAYVYMAVLALVPASVTWMAIGQLTCKRLSTAIGTFMMLALSAVALFGGLRTALMGILLPPAIFYCLTCKKSISRIWLPVFLVVGILTFALLRDVNNPAVGFAGALHEFTSDPMTVANATLSGSDTEMVDALSIEMSVTPSLLNHRPGLMIVSTIGAVVPRKVWPQKPQTADTILNGHFFDVGVNDASVAYSILGEAYFDSGLLGVGLAGFVIGAGFRKLTCLRLRSPDLTWPTLLYSFAAPLGVTLIRGILAYTLAYALFYVGPLLWGWRQDSHTQNPKDGLPMNTDVYQSELLAARRSVQS